ncbi:MAG: S24 family peptidase [Pleomorphochaeta sp.]
MQTQFLTFLGLYQNSYYLFKQEEIATRSVNNDNLLVHILKKLVRRFPEEQLFDGDLVVFVSNLIEGDGIYVISVDGELLVKRLEFDHFDKKLIIKSENPRYEVKVVDPERAQILGKVVGWLHHHPY